MNLSYEFKMASHQVFSHLTLLHSEQPKLHRVLAVLSAIGLRTLDAINIIICE